MRNLHRAARISLSAVGGWNGMTDGTRLQKLFGRDPALQLGGGALIAFAVFATLFSAVPELDLIVARQFYSAGHGFVGQTAVIEVLRSLFKLLYVLACALAITGLVASLAGQATLRGFSRAKWLFLVLCLSVGPGLVCNLALKDGWGRARPSQIVAFGGNKAFTPALMPAAECKSNCSFTCGEASSIFMLFFALSLVFRRHAARLLAGGVIAGSLAGLIRMAQGGHFLSDVIFAGISMALVAVLLYQLLYAGWLSWSLSQRSFTYPALARFGSFQPART